MTFTGHGRIRRIRRSLARWWHRRRGVALESLRRWVWSPHQVPLKYDGCRIWVLATSDIERRYRVRGADKEPWTIDWLKSSAATGDQVTALLGEAGLRLVKTMIRDKAGAPWYGVFERFPAAS